MRSIARYPEIRKDGSLWVPLAPPPAPTYRQLSREDVEVTGRRAIVAYSTEWLLDLRITSNPYQERSRKARWVVQLWDEGAWHDFKRHGTRPKASEVLVASVSLVFEVE